MTVRSKRASAKAAARVRRRRRLFAAVALALCVPLVLDVAWLDHRIRQRLGDGGTQARARFFSDRFRLVPGMDVERVHLVERLAQRGYRERAALDAPGTWRRRAGALEIRLRPFSDPDGTLPERWARLRLDGSRVGAIVDVPTGTAHAQASLEPALLDAAWIGTWQRRHRVEVAALPAHVVNAILAAEDVRFFTHAGVDLRGVVRALAVNLRARHVVEGASTITQQLAKTLFLTPERTWRRKIQQVLLAGLLELRLAKPQILGLYLNEVYLGRHDGTDVIGIGAAARTFFGKDAAALTVGEAATIAGIIPAPNATTPLRYPARAQRRRDDVLRAMVRAGFLAAAAAAAARRAPLALAPGAAPPLEGAFLLEQVRQEVETRLGADAVAARALDVYTTVDPVMQRRAEPAVREAVAGLERAHRWLRGRTPPLESAFVALDFDHGGAVRVLVGGRDFGRRPFDRAVRARRQAGSTFKPFVYLAAFATAPDVFTPSTLLDDRPFALRTGGRVWRPVNYDGRFRGPVTVRTALENSLNVPTVRLSQRVGIATVAATAARAGWRGDLPQVPALALGAAETSLLELAGAYTVFPRLGVPVTPYMLRGVQTPDGTIVYRHAAPANGEPAARGRAARGRAADPRATYLVHHILEGVVTRGTARTLRARGFTGPLAGKTGTTNDYRDAWFVGYTPRLLGAAWVGFDDGHPMRLSSAATAIPVWAAAMRPLLDGQPQGTFTVPRGIRLLDVDPATGLLPAPECPGRLREAFVAGTEPRARCYERPDLLPARPAIEEPREAPVRVIRDWVRQVFRLFGGAPPRDSARGR